MAKTNLDEIIDYPAQAIKQIADNKECVALLLNKKISTITDDDVDEALDRYIYDYEYVDNTITETSAYIWVEAEVSRGLNKQINNMKLYVTVACHKSFMKMSSGIIAGITGNRRDNLVRFIDKVLNGNDLFGIGNLKLDTVKTISSSNSHFTIRELQYSVSDFNKRENYDEITIR